MSSDATLIRLLAHREACRRADAALGTDGEFEKVFTADLTQNEQFGINAYDLIIARDLEGMLDAAKRGGE